ncbi:MAG: hypothetical protein ACPGYT_12270 [Nitrospirales bacterium]
MGKDPVMCQGHKRCVCFVVVLLSVLTIGCSSQPSPVSLAPEVPALSSPSPDKTWIIGPPLKGDEYGDWYYLRARVSSHDILFYQLCLRDRRDGDEGWAFYEKTFDEQNREYPTVVLNRKVDQRSVMKELLGIMLTREDLENARREGLVLHVKGQFDTMRVWIQAPYARGFLSLVDESIESAY